MERDVLFFFFNLIGSFFFLFLSWAIQFELQEEQQNFELKWR